MLYRTKIAIVCCLIPLTIATTVSITYAALGAFDKIDLGMTSQSTIYIGALPKRELVVSHFFFWSNEPTCRGTITFHHEFGETIVKSYSFNSHSQYMETVSQSIVVDLKPGKWTMTHQRTSGEAELEIKSTVSGSQDLDIGGVVTLWVLAVIMVFVGIYLWDEGNYEKLVEWFRQR